MLPPRPQPWRPVKRRRIRVEARARDASRALVSRIGHYKTKISLLKNKQQEKHSLGRLYYIFHLITRGLKRTNGSASLKAGKQGLYLFNRCTRLSPTVPLNGYFNFAKATSHKLSQIKQTGSAKKQILTKERERVGGRVWQFTARSLSL
jgi:hypothetical protein